MRNMIRKISLFLVLMCIALPAIGSGYPPLGTAPEETVPVLPQSLSGSVVTFDNGSQGYDTCFAPGASQTFCFLADSYTDDWEYVYMLWMRFPGDWIVNNVFFQGTPVCDSGGEWGPFNWWFEPEASPYEVNIYHPRLQEENDHCYTYYCFDVVSGSGSPDALESWYWAGDGYADAPHHPCSSDNYTPASMVPDDLCDEAVNPQASVPPCPPGLYLKPESTDASGCPRVVQTHTLTVLNTTGSPVTADLTYSVISGDGTCGGPATIGPIADLGSEQFNVFIYPDCTAGGIVVCEVTVHSGMYSDTATISKECVSGAWNQVATEPDSGRMDNVVTGYNNLVWSVTGYGDNADVRTYDPATDTWTTIPGSAPSFGANYARSGCQNGSKVYIYGDSSTAGFTGLWSYNMDSNTWINESPTGTPPAQTGVWAPAWVSDPETGYCYLTGGATTPGGGDLATVHVYDPAGNEWLAPLSSFTTARNFHAAFIFTSPVSGHKLLCVAGGVDDVSSLDPVFLNKTQCYDFNTGSWNAEDADLGTLPTAWWGMGYTDKWHSGTDHQLWLTAGRVGDAGSTTSSQTFYFDVNSGTWVDGGVLPGGAVFRASATTLNNEIYKLGGDSGGFTPQGWTDRHVQCTGCELISFSDIPAGYWAEDFIYAIACEGITTGYPDGTYKPADAVNRAQMAAFIIRALFGEDFAYSLTPHFTDVPSGHWAFKYIQKMFEEGITTGYGDGTYRPANAVNRAQMAPFIIRSLFGEVFPYSPVPYFTDVGDTYWAFKYIQKMSEERITTGYGDGTYRPEFTLNRAQMATFLGRAYLAMK